MSSRHLNWEEANFHVLSLPTPLRKPCNLLIIDCWRRSSCVLSYFSSYSASSIGFADGPVGFTAHGPGLPCLPVGIKVGPPPHQSKMHMMSTYDQSVRPY